MSKHIVSSAVLPARPERLYEMYLDPESHSAFTGGTVEIGPHPGDPFRAFDGMLTGSMIHTQAGRLIAQTWRSTSWPAEASDSVVVLTFWPQAGEGRIELVHAHVPDEDVDGVSEGWHKYYWGPWRTYLSRP